ncbi:MAG: enoyl-CoA hydratase-related protein, partial [Candidatus Fonsibacter sp.]
PREMQPLINLVGKNVTLEILLEGRVFDSTEALQKRLVSKIVPDNDVEKEAYETAQRIADGAPLVARWHKKFAKEISKNETISDKMNDQGYKCYDTEDFNIGYKSFLNKTKPKFKNK